MKAKYLCKNINIQLGTLSRLSKCSIFFSFEKGASEKDIYFNYHESQFHSFTWQTDRNVSERIGDFFLYPSKDKRFWLQKFYFSDFLKIVILNLIE